MQPCRIEPHFITYNCVGLSGHPTAAREVKPYILVGQAFTPLKQTPSVPVFPWSLALCIPRIMHLGLVTDPRLVSLSISLGPQARFSLRSLSEGFSLWGSCFAEARGGRCFIWARAFGLCFHETSFVGSPSRSKRSIHPEASRPVDRGPWGPSSARWAAVSYRCIHHVASGGRDMLKAVTLGMLTHVQDAVTLDFGFGWPLSCSTDRRVLV